MFRKQQKDLGTKLIKQKTNENEVHNCWASAEAITINIHHIGEYAWC